MTNIHDMSHIFHIHETSIAFHIFRASNMSMTYIMYDVYITYCIPLYAKYAHDMYKKYLSMCSDIQIQHSKYSEIFKWGKQWMSKKKWLRSYV
jgi:hypothetical protein